MDFSDDFFMQQAIKEAIIAFDNGEVPIGAVLVANNKIIGRGHNQTQQMRDITAHAEIIAISAASENIGAKYLENCTLYTTLEPCVMCAGALFWAKIERIVIGASDSKFGYNTHGNLLHPKTKKTSGVKEEECSALLIEFFKKKRNL